MAKTEASADALVLPLWPETGRRLGLSRNATYDAARRGEIPTVQFGRLKKVPMWFHKQLSAGTPKPVGTQDAA